ncbi:sensor histidine kinase [Alkalihalobacillus deserti]|uniref:sensor histidine kinase n=1 Tax=Alkalihalobacillus deserti TaxID=2879466 RepID=UPI001D138ADF|nr:HAMP domain-containing sensor histidine kinase [Alkalihalobacillus deserti]
MKIQYQLWLIFSCLFIVVCLAVYIVVSTTYEQRLQLGYEQVSITQGSTILDQFKDTYPYSPNRSIGYLQTYSKQLNSRLIMLDHDKKVYADSFQQLKPNTTLNLTILAQDTVPVSLFSETDPFGYLQYTLLPFQTVESEGYLLMIQEVDQLYAELKSFQKWIVQTLLIAVFVFFFISYFISTWFSKPIRQIIFHLKEVTPQKRFFSLKHPRRDEITDLINAIQNMVGELNLYDERQRRFLSTSSHELKTPLATMQLILENLPYVRENEATYQEFVQDLSFQVQKMKQMVDQLLQINRISDKYLEKETLIAGDLQHHLLQSFQHLAQDRQITLEFEFDPVQLYVNRAMFLRGLDNLVSNAIRYSPQDASVKIIIKSEEEQYKISVCDQGMGISPEDLPHIFEPFYRSNDATAWNQEGSGLGLTIVKQMVEMHNGRIEIDTEQNQGTCIHLLF